MPPRKRQFARPAGRQSPELWLAVEGYKAVRNRQALRIAPLTLISGVNSSGKSSFMQPFLMMKQTLDSTFDPGPLLLYGANVKVTEFQQMFSRGKSRSEAAAAFSVELRRGESSRNITFDTYAGGIRIKQDEMVTIEGQKVALSEPLTQAQKKNLRKLGTQRVNRYVKYFPNRFDAKSWQPDVYRNRCFLEPLIRFTGDGAEDALISFGLPLDESDDWVEWLRGIIHVPGLRGNPERAYQRSAVGNTYPGTFDTYVASVIAHWSDSQPTKLASLAADLERLGLTWKVSTRRVDDASVEVMVGRMPHAQQGGANDLVSMADVGFGVSQTLPVLAALHAAEPGQLVYIEQPEVHLHPKAQWALAESLVRAANRGVYVVAETHSSLLIRGIQTAVAKGELRVRDLSLNWFSREAESGHQQIVVAEVDQAGRFGDWPLDFDEVSRDADWAYLDAVEESQ